MLLGWNIANVLVTLCTDRGSKGTSLHIVLLSVVIVIVGPDNYIVQLSLKHTTQAAVSILLDRSKYDKLRNKMARKCVRASK